MKIILSMIVALWLAANALPLQAQTMLNPIATADENTAVEGPSEQDLQDLIRLLSSPGLVERLQQRLPETAEQQADAGHSIAQFQARVRDKLDLIEIRVAAIADALRQAPRLPRALSRAWADNVASSDFLRSAIYVIVFLFGGFGLEWLYWNYLSATLQRIELSKPETYGSILKAAGLRAIMLFGSIAVFAFGSIGLFVSFEWPDFINQIVLSLLAGIIIMRFIVMIVVFVLAPKVDDLRLMPLDQATAKNIYFWILAVSGVALLGVLFIGVIEHMGVDAPTLLAAETIARTVFITVLIAAIWRSAQQRKNLVLSDGSAMTLPVPGNLKLVLTSVLLLGAFVLWLLGMAALMRTLVALFLLFPAIRLAHVMVNHIFDHVEGPPPELQEEADGQGAIGSPGPANRYELYRPIADRLIRFLLVIIVVLSLGMVWDVTSMLQSTSNTFAGKVFGVAIDIVFALLIADLIWTWAKAAIERKLASFPVVEPGRAPGAEARMATLLPMIQKVLLVTICIMVALIVLSSLGVNIGPILAGAGVVGIALGFGAQALVKDIFSGVFFLIDDAFRVGEYIEMGALRGTVEAVSIRSLRVRHHRGALHTIPYGELAALTNYSRDWVIMKLEFRVPFDTDVKLFKKIIKKVGANLQANEAYGQHLLEPLKSQGVRRMEEFNMVLGVKFKAVPGEQWTIRRDAYQQIRDEMEKNGIHFAERNVKVEVLSDRPLSKEEEEAAVSAAQISLEQQGPPKPAPDEP
jgi:small-conductance mechanosensitive channel